MEQDAIIVKIVVVKIKVGNFGDIPAFSTMNRKIHMTGPTGGLTFTKSRNFI